MRTNNDQLAVQNYMLHAQLASLQQQVTYLEKQRTEEKYARLDLAIQSARRSGNIDVLIAALEKKACYLAAQFTGNYTSAISLYTDLRSQLVTLYHNNKNDSASDEVFIETSSLLTRLIEKIN